MSGNSTLLPGVLCGRDLAVILIPMMGRDNWNSLFGILIGSCFLRSLLIPTFFQFMRSFSHPLYSSGQCLLKLVNQTTTIETNHHPFYRTSHYIDDCDLDQYVKSQYQNHEEIIFKIFLICLSLTVLICFVLTYKQILTIHYLPILFIGYHLQLLQHCYMHFGQDVTFLAGNVMHHADISNFPYGKSEFLAEVAPDGVAFTCMISIIWSMFARSLILQLDPELRSYLDWKALLVATASMGLYVASRAKYSHSIWHTIATKEMESALPFSENYFAYQHVFVHHETGGAFGPNPFFDPFFSIALDLYSHLHNNLLNLTIPSTENISFAIIYDFILGCFVMCGYWIILRFGKFLDQAIFGEIMKSDKKKVV
jgi:hypothetical protein